MVGNIVSTFNMKWFSRLKWQDKLPFIFSSSLTWLLMSLRLKKLKHSIKEKEKRLVWFLWVLLLLLLLLLSLSLQFSCSFNSKCVIIFMLFSFVVFFLCTSFPPSTPLLNEVWIFSSVLVPCGFQDTIFLSGFSLCFNIHLVFVLFWTQQQPTKQSFIPRLQKSLMCIFSLYIFKLLHTSYTFAAVLY